MSGTRKLALTALLFLVATALVAAAAATQRVYPLFAAWLPLVAVPWVLARPAPGEPSGSTEEQPEG